MSYFHIWHRITFQKCRHKYRESRRVSAGSLPSPRAHLCCIYLINSELFNLIELEGRPTRGQLSPCTFAYFKPSRTSLQRFLGNKIWPPSLCVNNFTVLWTGEQLGVGVFFYFWISRAVIVFTAVDSRLRYIFIRNEFLIFIAPNWTVKCLFSHLISAYLFKM